MIVDTHTHLYLPEFDVPEAAVKRALDAGVGHMVFPNVDLTTVEPMLALHERFPSVTSVAMGLHPTEVNDNWMDDLDKIERELKSGRNYVAVGEIGIDLYWESKYRSQQRDALARQIAWANELVLPVILHCREGLDDLLDVLKSGNAAVNGVFHSFGGTADDVARIRETGDFYFGINGIVTFKNSKLREVLPVIGVDRLLLETDAPYLAPVPNRGKRNESSFIVHTAAYVASALGIDREELEEITTANARRLFRL